VENNLPKKFENVDSLVKAYENLEKEFTKRCEMVGSLQKQVESLNKELASNIEKSAYSDSSKDITEQDKQQIIEEFLKGIAQTKTEAILTCGGEAVRTPPRKPKTLKEANLMAKYFLKKGD